MRETYEKNRKKFGKYYKYHKDHRHFTKHCRELDAFLESLFKEGKLQKYVSKDSQKLKTKKAKGKRPLSPTLESRGSEERGTNLVNVIYGGRSMGESRSYTWKVLSASTSNAKGKRPLQDDALYFTEDDMKKVMKHHEDPLVIEADIRQNNRVSKIMVDMRSFVDILYINAYKRMGQN